MRTWLDFGKKVFLYVLYRDPDENISLPTHDEVSSYQSVTTTTYPNVGESRDATNGLNLFIQAAGRGNE